MEPNTSSEARRATPNKAGGNGTPHSVASLVAHKISTSIKGASVPFISVMAKDPKELESSSPSMSTPIVDVKKTAEKEAERAEKKTISPIGSNVYKNTTSKGILYSLIVLLMLIVLGNVAWSAYQTIEYKKTIQSLQGAYDKNAEELALLKASSTQSSELLGNLYTTLSNVINEEKAKNESLEAKLGSVSNTVGSLEKLSKSDPQLLKKYSKVYFLNENYTPMSLAVLPVQYGFYPNVSYQFHSEAAPFLISLIDTAKSDGYDLRVISAYRSFATQVNVKKMHVVKFGTTQANQFSAEQGFSEHQLGTTVDFTTPKTGDNFSKFEGTPEFTWLKNNAYKYGFVLSYPKNNTYYAYEPWHWRFVGIELASQLHAQERYFYDYDQRVIDEYLTKMFDK